MKRGHDRRNLHPRLARTIALAPIVLGTTVCSSVAYVIGIIPSFARSVPGTTLSALYPIVVFIVFVWAIPVIGYGGSLWIWWPTFGHHPRHRAVVLKATVVYLAVLSPSILLTLLLDPFLGSMASIVLALIGCGVAVIVINRKLAAPDHAGGAVPCPHCAYDMRGQHECRCPECGAQFTVGELIIPAPNPYA